MWGVGLVGVRLGGLLVGQHGAEGHLAVGNVGDPGRRQHGIKTLLQSNEKKNTANF